MRRNIFKGEFEYLCNKLKVEKDNKYNLFSSIFDGTPSDTKEYYELKEEIYDYKNLIDIVNSILGTVENTKIIKNIFTISSDLNYIPEHLINEVKLKNIAVFVGAGLSKVASIKYPLWDDLANNSIDYLHEQGKINFFEKERLKRDISDPKQKLSIFEKYVKKDTQEYRAFLSRNFENVDTSNSTENPYHILSSETFNFIKVTSNVDLEFVNAFSTQHLSKNGVMTPVVEERQKQNVHLRKIDSYIEGTKIAEKFRYDKIYMIHGNILDYQNTIFTTDDYIKEYFSKDGKISQFLEKLFQNYTVLFIGYGLSEFPILERIISAGRRRHYVLLPTFLSEINYFRKQASYLEKLNITALPYYIDSEGYSRVNSVLKNWEKIISKSSLENINSIDDFLREVNGNQ
jgi:hypothetical protein